jgi:AbrB family looped-hinge helix DNA binding protein
MEMGARALITSKGQITLPKEVRDRLSLKPGDAVEFIEEGGRTWVHPRTLRAVDLAGILHRPGMKTVTVEEMHNAIGEALVEDDERIKREWDEGRS